MVGNKQCWQNVVKFWSGVWFKGLFCRFTVQATSRCCLSFPHRLGFAMDGLRSIKGMHFASQVTVIRQNFKYEHGEEQKEFLFPLLHGWTPLCVRSLGTERNDSQYTSRLPCGVVQGTGYALKKPSGSRTACIYGKPPTAMLIYDVVNSLVIWRMCFSVVELGIIIGLLF